MKVKKLGIVLISILLIAAVWVSSMRMENLAKINNVFDEMYYAGTQSNFFKITGCSIEKMGVWQKFSYIEKNIFRYKRSYLQSGEQITISFNEESHCAMFLLSIQLSSESNLEIIYEYDSRLKELRSLNVMVYIDSDKSYNTVEYDKKMLFFISDEKVIRPLLKQNGITYVQIENWKNYLVYEKLLPDLFNANQGKSRFSMENLGDFTVVDNTFALLDGE